MSGDSPFDPFGRSDRTIIRPNPGGRRTTQPAPATPAAPAQPPPPPVARPPLPSDPSLTSLPAGGDEWVMGVPEPSSPAGQPQPARAHAHEKALVLRREDLITPNANALLRAAAPLLLLLGRLRVALLSASPAQLMEQVADAIKEFERDVRAAGISAEQPRRLPNT